MDQGTNTAANDTMMSFETKKQAEDFAVVCRTFVLLLTSVFMNCIALCVSVGQGAILASLYSLFFFLLSSTALILYILFIVLCIIVAFPYVLIKVLIQKFRKPRRDAVDIETTDRDALTAVTGWN